MAFTLTDLEAIETALKSGAQTVKYQDRVVEYRSLKDLLALRKEMRKELGLVDESLTFDYRIRTDKNLP